MRLALALVFIALAALVVALSLRGSVPRGPVALPSPEARVPLDAGAVGDRPVDVSASTRDASGVLADSGDISRLRSPRVASSDPADEDSSAPDAGSFSVVVVTSEGTPARGVTLSFELESTRATHILSEQRTAEDGRATFELADVVERRTSGARTPNGTLRIIAEVLHPELVTMLLQEFPENGDELRLELPPGGTIVARVTGPDGAVVTGPSMVSCELRDRDGEEPHRRSRIHHFGPIVETIAGVARIEHVALDVEFDLSAGADGHEWSESHTVVGPSSSGAEVEVALVLAARLAMIRTRVLTGADAPLRDAVVRVSLALDPPRFRYLGERPWPEHMSEVGTDDAGGVELEVSPRLDPLARDVWVIWTDPAWNGQGPRDHFGRAWLPASVTAGAVIDAGEIVLAPAPLVAAGSVVGADGMALEHATLEFSERFAHDPASRWFPMESSRVQTDAAGQFALYGTSRPTALKANVEAVAHVAREFQGLVPGETGARFVLERAAPAGPRSSLAFELEVDDVLRGVPLTVTLERDGDDGPAVAVEAPTWPTQFGRLHPGAYTLEVLLREAGIRLVRLEGIEVRAGQLTSDPRLTPLDLSGAARRVDLDARLPDESPWAHALVEVTPEGQAAWATGETGAGGAVTFFVPRACTAISARLVGSKEVVRVPLLTGSGPLRVVLRRP